MQPASKSILDYLKEVSIVVIGVLIAVSIGNYKEKEENKRYVNKMLLAIEQEINSSKKDVEDVLNRHYTLADSITVAMENNEETLAEVILKSGGIQLAETKNIGLRFFISNKADLVDYEMIAQLSEIEASSKLLMKKMDRLIEDVNEMIHGTDIKVKEKFLILLANVIDSEERLLTLYGEFLEKNKVYLQAASPQ